MEGPAALGIVAIGASLGGLDSLRAILGGLPGAFLPPVVIVQHRSPDFNSELAGQLAAVCRLPLTEAEDKQPIEPGWVFLAPPDYHLLVDGEYLALSLEAPVNWARPSIDVLFASAAARFERRTTAVVLSGTGRDGAAGAAAIAEAGGLVIVESLDTVKEKEMPAAALQAAPQARSLPAADIGRFLAGL